MKKMLFQFLTIAIFAFIGVCAIGDMQTKDPLPDVYTVAVLPFSERGSGVKSLGKQISELLFASLVEKSNLWLVERQEIDKILEEQHLNASGLTNPSTSAKLGELTGAKLLITGSVFKIRSKTFIVTKVIGTETGRVVGKSVHGNKTLDMLVKELAGKISALIDKSAQKLMPKIRAKKDVISELKAKLGGVVKKSLFLNVNERHIGSANFDPAIETEINSVCGQLGFKVINKKDSADVVIEANGFSEFAARRGRLLSVKARVEMKITDKDGNLIAADKQTSVAVDVAELIAGKRALQEATLKLLDKLLPKLNSK